ncbi:MAG: hypothetical protein EOR01_17460 [Mesorhizobium sp.]|uniref:hypothetical protein n=1 Tax=Mesorhizobium sp. TaxID=1871066 RepID=UPI000FEA2C1F|nr:hypothetical protein [Mesorhizobium sp.]RWP21020.1 MAG: hypothetical protein EOR01_17460 [Mesorhizobium sp.]
MAREFSKISPAIWGSHRFLRRNSEERLLLLYFMTNEHQNSAGCYRLPDGYAMSDLGWNLEQYKTVRDQLVVAELISFDAYTSEIFVNRWFLHNPPTNPAHAKGAMTLISKIDSDKIRETVEAEFVATDWGARMTENPSDLDPQTSNSRLANTSLMKRAR